MLNVEFLGHTAQFQVQPSLNFIMKTSLFKNFSHKFARKQPVPISRQNSYRGMQLLLYFFRVKFYTTLYTNVLYLSARKNYRIRQ